MLLKEKSDPAAFKEYLIKTYVLAKEAGWCTEEYQIKKGLTYTSPFSEKEINDWVSKMEVYAKQHNICGSFNGLSIPPAVTSTITLSLPLPATFTHLPPQLTCFPDPPYGPTSLYTLPTGEAPGTYVLDFQEISQVFKNYACKKGALTVNIFQNNKYFGSVSSPFFPFALPIK